MDFLLKDFVGLAIWALVTMTLWSVNKRTRKLARGDFIFVSIVLLITCELAWLLVGY